MFWQNGLFVCFDSKTQGAREYGFQVRGEFINNVHKGKAGETEGELKTSFLQSANAFFDWWVSRE